MIPVRIDKFAGGPVGITTLSTSVQEERNTGEDIYEPYLIQEGFLRITSRGRLATEKAFRYFNKKACRRNRCSDGAAYRLTVSTSSSLFLSWW